MFCYQHFGCGCGNITGVIYVITADDKACAILFRFFGAYTAYKLAVCYILESVFWDLTCVDEFYSVFAFDVIAHSICQLSKFVGG